MQIRMHYRGKVLAFLLIIFVLYSLSACNPIFVMQAAYEQSKILVSRQPITEVIDDPSTSDEDKFKLQLVQLAREFTKGINLSPQETFTSYSKLSRDPVAWVVSASKKDKFEPYTWWFPIVGSIPYRGYFNQEDAVSSAKKLEAEGFETWVRGTAAFSTLGWFNDPLLSSTLKLSAIDVVNTVIHETVHATVWIPGSVSFNESLANYVGHRASIDFFNWLNASPQPLLDQAGTSNLLNLAKQDFERELDFAEGFDKVYEALSILYGSEASLDDKLARRELIYSQELLAFRNKYPDTKLPLKLNNAEIMQRRLYLTKLRAFDSLFLKVGSDWGRFMDRITLIYANPGDKEEETFALLDKDSNQL